MSLLAMPWVVINMGCEMVYILDQRLKAQNVTASKSAKVLYDVVSNMFNKNFIEEKLFIPQQMYTISSIRNVFDRLAHSSIMRLSEASMDKLFDLMAMAAKYQVFCGSRFDDMMHVILRHIKTVGSIMEEHLPPNSSDLTTVYKLLSNAEVATRAMYGNLSVGQWTLLRCTLGRFFQDKKVKVSLFLSEGIQTPSGRLILPSCTASDLGSVTTFKEGGEVAGRSRVPLAVLQADGNEFFCHPTPFGENLYSKERARVQPPPRSHDEKPAGGAAAPSGQAGPQSQKAQLELTGGGQVARQELDLLSAVMQIGAAKPTGNDNFKLNLFGEDEGEAATDTIRTAPDPRFATAPVSSSGVREAHFGQAGVNAAYRQQSALAGVLKDLGMDGEGGKGGKQQAGLEQPDLLDLLDSAG